MPPDLDSKEKLFSKKLMDKLCIKIKEIENMDLSHFEVSSKYKTDILAVDPAYRFSYEPSKSANCIEPVQPCLPPNVAWTWGLLHDSESEAHENKMERSFSKLFYNNCSEAFDQEFVWNKSDERNDGHSDDRIKFRNKQNLLVTERSERSADVDKLIAKFDTNIEDIWKTTSESDYLKSVKYQTLFSQNFFPNPFVQLGSNLIWAFEENKIEGRLPVNEQSEAKEILPDELSSRWNNFSSPVSTRSRAGLDAVFGAFGLVLSNAERCRAADACVDGSVNAGTIACCETSVFENEKLTVDVSQNSQEDEDLLTSAKTHFRPIRAEDTSGSQAGTYADGTTFAISNDLEKVSFKRSESGALYLEADADTPRKYMEFKEKDVAGFNGKEDWENEIPAAKEFVPKFRVRHNNEKCCQTDEIDEEQVVPSLTKSDCDSVSQESDEDEFYFPGDDELAQNIINAVEEKLPEAEGNELSISGPDIDAGMEFLEMSLYKLPEDKECICSRENDWAWNGTEGPTEKQEWSAIWNSQSACAGCRMNSNKLSSKDKFRFREELTQEGEQLLMDLSCLQQMYSNSDWGDGGGGGGGGDDDDDDDDSTSASASDLNEEEGPPEDFISSATNDSGKGGWWTYLVAKDEPARSDFDLRCLWKEEKFLSNLIKNKSNETNERPLVADVVRTERKRRNSSSQKACNLYLEGQCRRPHCRFAHCDSAVPCPFFADASCMKGESCPLSHSARRPLSL